MKDDSMMDLTQGNYRVIPKMRLEYVWLDGYNPSNLRSKVKYITSEGIEENQGVGIEVPDWSFDGSSTKQAEGKDSDCVLKPKRLYKNPVEGGYIVLCEVYLPNGKPHPSNQRQLIVELDKKEYWWGFEQEYFLIDMKTGKPLGWPEEGYPEPQGEYYCGLGAGNVKGRQIVEAHQKCCLQAGLSVDGTNAEVALGQWEYQCFGDDTSKACDDFWISRFFLYKLAEVNNVGVELHPKPYEGDWNGSGCHINFSNKQMREKGTKTMMTKICKALEKKHDEHIKVYGIDNEMRLTGLHETQHISKFSFGVSDRGASIRIPVATVDNKYKGYLEDRRPSSNVDPYQATHIIMKTIG